MEYLVRLQLEFKNLPPDRQNAFSPFNADLDLAKISIDYYKNYKIVKMDVLKKRGITPTARSESPNHLDFRLEEEQLKIVLREITPTSSKERRCCIS